MFQKNFYVLQGKEYSQKPTICNHFDVVGVQNYMDLRKCKLQGYNLHKRHTVYCIHTTKLLYTWAEYEREQGSFLEVARSYRVC